MVNPKFFQLKYSEPLTRLRRYMRRNQCGIDHILVPTIDFLRKIPPARLLSKCHAVFYLFLHNMSPARLLSKCHAVFYLFLHNMSPARLLPSNCDPQSAIRKNVCSCFAAEH